MPVWLIYAGLELYPAIEDARALLPIAFPWLALTNLEPRPFIFTFSKSFTITVFPPAPLFSF
jgi:hypothetical protein